jgi:hypothetical protein
MKQWIILGLFLGVSGCHGHDAPAQPLSVFEARTQITPGMDEDEVVALMGKPWRAEGWATTETAGILPVTTTFKRLFWHEGNKVARVDLTNDHVATVQLRDFPAWALYDLGGFGTSMSDVKQHIGPPSRSAKRKGLHQDETWWVYTDKTGSEKTMLLTFNAKGKISGEQLGPNRSDFDDIASN